MPPLGDVNTTRLPGGLAVPSEVASAWMAPTEGVVARGVVSRVAVCVAARVTVLVDGAISKDDAGDVAATAAGVRNAGLRGPASESREPLDEARSGDGDENTWCRGAGRRADVVTRTTVGAYRRSPESGLGRREGMSAFAVDGAHAGAVDARTGSGVTG